MSTEMKQAFNAGGELVDLAPTTPTVTRWYTALYAPEGKTFDRNARFLDEAAFAACLELWNNDQEGIWRYEATSLGRWETTAGWANPASFMRCGHVEMRRMRPSTARAAADPDGELRSGNLCAEILNEVTLYGGLPMRRGDVLALAKEHLGADAKEPFGAQWFALHGPSVELEPWPLAEARKLMGGAPCP